MPTIRAASRPSRSISRNVGTTACPQASGALVVMGQGSLSRLARPGESLRKRLVLESLQCPGTVEHDQRLAAAARADLSICNEHMPGDDAAARCLAGELSLLDVRQGSRDDPRAPLRLA